MPHVPHEGTLYAHQHEVVVGTYMWVLTMPHVPHEGTLCEHRHEVMVGTYMWVLTMPHVPHEGTLCDHWHEVMIGTYMWVITVPTMATCRTVYRGITFNILHMYILNGHYVMVSTKSVRSLD